MFQTEYNIFFALLTSLFVTYVAIPRVILFAEKFRLADIPGERASHKKSVPIFGGVAIFSGIILSLLFWSDISKIQFVLLSLCIVFFLGIIDDLIGLTPFKKIIGQIFSILIIIYFGDIKIDSFHGVLGIYEIPHLAATLFTTFVIIVITNAINLIDGVDGLAGGIGFLSSCAFSIVIISSGDYDMAIIAFALIGSLLAFLKYNFPPAKLFMGDTGSLLIGMILSILAIRVIGEGFVIDKFSFPNKGPLLAIAFLAIPLFDSLRVFIVRIRKGKHPLHPGRGHIHHALLDLGIGHKKTALFLYVVSILVIAVSYLLMELNINIAITILALFSYIILITPFYLLRKRNK